MAVDRLGRMEEEGGRPVEASVAAIFWATMPLLPIPVATTRPVVACIRATAVSNPSSRLSARERIAAASISRTRRASRRAGVVTEGILLAGRPARARQGPGLAGHGVVEDEAEGPPLAAEARRGGAGHGRGRGAEPERPLGGGG